MSGSLDKALARTGSRAKAPRSKRVVYTPALGRLICKRLADGKTLIEICERERMPRIRTVLRWALDEKHEFSHQYARARIVGYSQLNDQIIHIADNPDTSKGAVDRDRLRTDVRKWTLSKMLPKVYGDKIEQTHKLDADALFLTALRDVVTPKRGVLDLHVVNGGKTRD